MHILVVVLIGRVRYQPIESHVYLKETKLTSIKYEREKLGNSTTAQIKHCMVEFQQDVWLKHGTQSLKK